MVERFREYVLVENQSSYRCYMAVAALDDATERRESGDSHFDHGPYFVRYATPEECRKIEAGAIRLEDWR